MASPSLSADSRTATKGTLLVRPLQRLAHFRALVWIWSVPVLVAALQTHLFAERSWRPLPFWRAAAWQGLPWYVWVLLTPLIVRVVYAYPLVWPPRRRAISVHVAGAVLASVIFGAVFAVLDAVFAPPDLQHTDRWASVTAHSIVAWMPMTCVTYFAVAGIAMTFRLSERATELQTQLARAQLDGLRAQLRPHFFFNALNTVSALIRTGESERATRALAQIGDLLHPMLSNQTTDFLTLDQELQLARQYLDIETLRFSDRLHVTWDIADAARTQRVPAFILQPLVENAIRHGIAPLSTAGLLRVSAQLTPHAMVLEVSDDGPGWPRDVSRSTGVGLRNVRARLLALYGSTGRLEMDLATPHGAAARLTLPRTESS